MSENNDNYTANISEHDKIIFMKALVALAQIDGIIDAQEQTEIRDFAIMLGISADKVPSLMQPLSLDEVLQQVTQIKNRRVALALIREACFIANADGDITDKETLFIGRLGEAMGIELEKIEQISQWVINHLILQEQKKIIFETA